MYTSISKQNTVTIVVDTSSYRLICLFQLYINIILLPPQHISISYIITARYTQKYTLYKAGKLIFIFLVYTYLPTGADSISIDVHIHKR